MVEPPHKKVKANGCAVYGCCKGAQKRDPATGFWYCRICFHDTRPDLAKTPRCFVCFSTGDDVTESACGLQQSASCSAVRIAKRYDQFLGGRGVQIRSNLKVTGTGGSQRNTAQNAGGNALRKKLYAAQLYAASIAAASVKVGV